MTPIRVNLATLPHFDRRWVRLILILAATGGLLIAGCGLYRSHELAGRIVAFEVDVRRLDAERIRREQALQTEKTAVGEEEFDKTRVRAEAVNRLIAQDLFPWCRLLDALEAELPSTLYLTEVLGEDAGRRLRLRGYAASLDQVSGYLREKEDVALFDKIVLQNVEVEPEAEDGAGPPPVRFEIDSTVQPRRVFPADVYGGLWRTLRDEPDGTPEENGGGDAG